MNPLRRWRTAVAVLATLTAAGTLGFARLEGLAWRDALYLTVTTLSTVGYGDVVPVTDAGRLFAVVLIVVGVGTALYLFSSLAQLVVEGTLRTFRWRIAMERHVQHMQDHVIVCGFGRFGRVVVDELGGSGLDVVVVDRDPAHEDELRRRGVSYLSADAGDDATLARAGIADARALVVALPSDADNVFVTLSAREKRPTLPILARAESEAGMRRLELAGATRAVSAYHAGARRLAASLMHPSVVDVLDLSLGGRDEHVALEEVTVVPGSTLDGRTVAQAEALGPRLRIVAVGREERGLSLVPDREHVLAAGDLLVAIGHRDALDALARAAAA
jgi:voltage-gated potassium channel